MAASTRKEQLGKEGVSGCVRGEGGSGTDPRKDLDPNGKAKEKQTLCLVNSGWRKKEGGGVLDLEGCG